MSELLDDKKRLIQKMNELEELWKQRDQRLPPLVFIDEHPTFVAIACCSEEEGLLISISGDVVEKVFGPPSNPEDVAVYAEGFAEMYENIEHAPPLQAS